MRFHSESCPQTEGVVNRQVDLVLAPQDRLVVRQLDVRVVASDGRLNDRFSRTDHASVEIHFRLKADDILKSGQHLRR